MSNSLISIKQKLWITFFPRIFAHSLHGNYKQEDNEMETLPHVGTAQLKKIIFIKFFEHTALELDKLHK